MQGAGIRNSMSEECELDVQSGQLIKYSDEEGAQSENQELYDQQDSSSDYNTAENIEHNS